VSAAAHVARGGRDLTVGILCIGLIIAIWSGFQLASRFSARAGMNAADLAALRFTISGVLMLPWLVRHGLHGVGLPRAFALAATGGLGFGSLAFVGFMFAPASHAAVLMSGSLPLFTAVAASLLIGETLGAVKRLGLALIVAGIVLIGAESFARAGLGYWRGDLCFLAAAICWSLFTVACRAWRVTPQQGAIVVCTFTLFLYTPAYLLLATPHFAELPVGELIFQAVYQGVIATIVTIFAYTRAVASLGAATTTMLTAAVPGIVTLAAAPLLDETPSVVTLAGVAIVSLGMIATVLTLGSPQAKPKPT
jgi:drug/metabolite transporter (DMT)-like permease